MTLFKYTPRDLYLIIYALVALVLPWYMAYIDPAFYLWVAVGIFQVFFLVLVINTSMHYHMHCNIFNNTQLNRAYEYLVTMVTGIPFHGWLWFHSTHHRYNNDQKGKDGRVNDPVSFYRFGQNGKRENFWSYCILGLYRDFKGITLFDPTNTCSSKITPAHISIITRETWIIYLYLASIFCINFYYGLFYLLIWMLSLIGNNAKSYGEHYLAVDPNNYQLNSVGSYGRIFNFLCLNNGYHQEHHVNPGLHWSRLSELTTTLPKNRKIIKGIYAFNTPWGNDFKQLWNLK